MLHDFFLTSVHFKCIYILEFTFKFELQFWILFATSIKIKTIKTSPFSDQF